jgi:hypothetical protein
LRAEVDRLRQEVSSVAIENVGLRGERARIEPGADAQEAAEIFAMAIAVGRYEECHAEWLARAIKFLNARPALTKRTCLDCGAPLPDHWSFSRCEKHLTALGEEV